MLKVLGPHELDKYSRNAAFVNKSRIFFDLETYYTFLYHRSIFYRCYTTLIYKAVYSGNVHGIVELPTGCPTSCPLSDTSGNPRGRAYGVPGAPIGGTFQSPQNWENATVTWLWHLRSGTSVAQLAIRRLERLLSRTWWNWGIATPKKKHVIEHIEHWVWLHFSIFCVFLGFTI